MSTVVGKTIFNVVKHFRTWKPLQWREPVSFDEVQKGDILISGNLVIWKVLGRGKESIAMECETGGVVRCSRLMFAHSTLQKFDEPDDN